MSGRQRRNITINGRFLETTVTGVQRYAWEILRAIDRLAAAGHPATTGFDITLLRPAGATVPLDLAAIREVREGRRGGHFWEQVTLPRMAHGSTLLNLCNLGPVRHRNAILCIHDAHIWLTPENYSPAFRAYYRFMLPLLARRSRYWTTVSHFSEAQLRRFGVATRPAAAVIGNAVGEITHIAGRQPATVLPDRFVFALGSAARNKNMALIGAIAPRLAERGIGTVIAGGSNHAIFGDDGVDGAGVVRLGRIDDDELAWLYRHALCFAFPSFYEGFGIPPLEAMAAGCPVIAASTSALPETLGDAPLWRDPRDPEGWYEAVTALANDGAARMAATTRGFRQAARYSWTGSALAYLRLAAA